MIAATMPSTSTTAAKAMAMPAAPSRAPPGPVSVSEPTCTGMTPVMTAKTARPARTATTTTSETKANERVFLQVRSAVPTAERTFSVRVLGCSGIAGAAPAAACAAWARSPSIGASMVAMTPVGEFDSSVSFAPAP